MTGRKVALKPKRKPKTPASVEHPSGLTVRTADLARTRPFEWAWEQRVLLGYLNLLIGEEGIGKGNLAAWIGASITKGNLPGNLHGTPRRVVFVGDEDSWDHIWTPRLKVAGADLGLTGVIEAGGSGTLDLTKDAESLEAYIKQESIALVYFDQLLDNLGFTDSWRDKEVRDALMPLIRIAQTTSAALLASMHPNKRSGSFRDRISGTPAFNALSRSSLLAAEHPDEPGRTVVVRGKGNYSVEPEAFEFRIEGRALTLGRGTRQRVIQTSRITDIRETSLRRDDLLDAAVSRRRENSGAGQARTIIKNLLSEQEPYPARAALDLLEHEHGIPERTAQAARKEIGVHAWQEGFQGPWFWGWTRPKIKMAVVRAKSKRNGRPQ